MNTKIFCSFLIAAVVVASDSNSFAQNENVKPTPAKKSGVSGDSKAPDMGTHESAASDIASSKKDTKENLPADNTGLVGQPSGSETRGDIKEKTRSESADSPSTADD